MPPYRRESEFTGAFARLYEIDSELLESAAEVSFRMWMGQNHPLFLEDVEPDRLWGVDATLVALRPAAIRPDGATSG